ncbi:asparagine synthase (glutamine-hydrolyzing) [Candidatus Woesebacteria bacterium RIFCSPLOWO2_01_FULL_39_23]|uniref:asparagine synthase (glutamine-hydrolyzing) n=1 Tax=Candidatus Woesebacteria bacterium RIFCSPHIGHO2_01_FULL_40_22 TaxID=1802499 RepID=A0A1F7YJZ2_9BACT|nr:MAG: asparagine synthase (glutamine-hydrolyzing) [Candidatus Woesebacteria bacterium RBG_16_40_11]OGM27587.1 MAG: asparagine synthase (glutamine-hydrolyzing) [Candidatus Woesebacteria bacterium RIFCSPHIGHO2_01_FULL_40_22]OGM36741.1 MAG: asparagine synthase (glutamine-hydrolyzing) [Candidatus Woesebacteria bacterium RIFCSPHIGHO2_12_FULL_38_9]OGM62761.1 MAG: asparagine synthase (glutamine-hydrolyzing) [Candidatus Woesebacteria bacterium RIFCSPLOWO2_01_FULL_39_23]
MCGIAGFVDFTSETDPSLIKKMTDSIVYRGPDSSGKFISENYIAGLGIRRLSIIDLKTGDQPIKNEDGTITVVYNGEIYNYKELKLKLQKNGHIFKTKSDTEVLVHGYEEYGLDLVKKLNGMFAFALWDEKQRKLLLGRDRVGIKPLYFYESKNLLVFGSEPKTILCHPSFHKSINLDAMSNYLYFGFLPHDYSMYSGIKKLLPGNILSFSKRGATTTSYFGLTDTVKENNNSLSELLDNAVKSQLMADVPVGVFLSGGLDSSLISYYVAKRKKLKSFSIGFKEPGFDESESAYYVAKIIGTDHHSEEFSVKDVVPIFNQLIKYLDEPLADASLVPTYKVSKLAAKYVKVVLSGDGGDELFGGYPTYQAHLMAKYFDSVRLINPDKLKNILGIIPESLINKIPLSFKDYPKKKLGEIVLRGLKLKNPDRHLYWMRTFFLGDKNLGQNPDRNWTKSLITEKPGVNIGQLIDFQTYLPDDFLVKTDRASMFNSLETRVPYLDNDVINYAFTTRNPHVTLLKTKIQLRGLLEKNLPQIAKRPKKGFGLPLEKWLRGDLKKFAKDHLENKKLDEFVERKEIEKIWKEHQDYGQNNSGTIWQLIILSGWLDNYS